MSDDETIPQVSVADTQAALGTGTVQVVDVRPSFDFAGGRIPGSLSLPNRSLVTRLEQLDSGKRILFVSEYGDDAEGAARLARSLGCADVAVVAGGFDAWLDADYPIHTIDDGT